MKLIISILLLACISNLSLAQSATDQQTETKPDSVLTSKEKAERLSVSYFVKFLSDDLDGAYEDICKLIELQPTPEYHYFRGKLALYKKNYNQAAESFNYCINHEYEVEDAAVYLGRAYYNAWNYSNAISAFSRALDVNAQNVSALSWRADCKQNILDYAGAVQDYKLAIKYEGIVDEPCVGFYGLVYAKIAYLYLYYLEGDYITIAKEYNDEALKRIQNINEVWETAGVINYANDNWGECIRCLNNAITIEENADMYLYRGGAKAELGIIADAYRDWQRAVELGCERAAGELKKFDSNEIDFSKTSEYSNMFKSISIKKGEDPNLKILAIELTNEATIFYMEYTNTEYHEGGWYSIDPNTYIVDKLTEEKHYILTTDKCDFSPTPTPIGFKESIRFTLYFPQISTNCRELDFVESGMANSPWEFYGIMLK